MILPQLIISEEVLRGGLCMDNLGVYVHIPFCASKCQYCDFFSKCGTYEEMNRYTDAVNKALIEWGKKLVRSADTLYIGGGTPGLLGAERLISIAAAARSAFNLKNAEITAELNPASSDENFNFELLRLGGFNRLSIGMQSANDNELRRLGRIHTATDVKNTVRRARAAGFENISLDLMLCIPEQTNDSLIRSIKYCAELGADHVSAYILKIEDGTPFYKEKDVLTLDEETQAERYMLACEQLEKLGYIQYEISNFAKNGKKSRHNLKYWNCNEYLGIGSAAHSYLNGKRFYTERSFEEFYSGIVHDDGDGGSVEEYIMLRLRLTEGLTQQAFRRRFKKDIPTEYFAHAKKFEKAGLLVCNDNEIKFTKSGFLVSNSLIAEII